MDKFTVKLDGMEVVGSYDGNSDGESSAEVKIFLKEVYEELADKGEAKVDAVVSFKVDGGKVILSVDTDKDGEPVATIMLDAVEGLQEAL